MFIDKDFEELWHFDNLPERISVGDYGLFEEERETLINYIKGFFRYIREQGHVPLSDFARYMEFFDMLCETQDEALMLIVTNAMIETALLRNEEEEKEEELLRELYRKYWDAMIRKDAAFLRGLMAEDYHLEHMTGVRQSGEEFLRGLLDGTFNYYSAEHDSIEVRIDGMEAVMSGKSRVLASVYGGGKHEWRLQGDFRLRNEGGGWKMLASRVIGY